MFFINELEREKKDNITRFTILLDQHDCDNLSLDYKEIDVRPDDLLEHSKVLDVRNDAVINGIRCDGIFNVELTAHSLNDDDITNVVGRMNFSDEYEQSEFIKKLTEYVVVLEYVIQLQGEGVLDCSDFMMTYIKATERVINNYEIGYGNTDMEPLFRDSLIDESEKEEYLEEEDRADEFFNKLYNGFAERLSSDIEVSFLDYARDNIVPFGEPEHEINEMEQKTEQEQFFKETPFAMCKDSVHTMFVKKEENLFSVLEHCSKKLLENVFLYQYKDTYCMVLDKDRLKDVNAKYMYLVNEFLKTKFEFTYYFDVFTSYMIKEHGVLLGTGKSVLDNRKKK